MALLYVLIFAVRGWQVETPVLWLLSAWLLALALIDLDTMTLPHPLTKWGLIVGLLLKGLTTGLGGLTEAIVVAVIGIWLFDLIRWGGAIALGQEVMGGGDGKLAAMIGAWLGWRGLLVTFFLACALGGLVGGLGIALGWIQRRQPIPFGPFLAVAAILSALFGQQLIRLYFEIFLPGVFIP